MKSCSEISVIIATYNRRALLERTLSTLINQDIDPSRYEVIVVSDGCTDGTAVFLQNFSAECDIRFVEQHPNQGQTKAANVGAKAARGKYLLFLDDDVVCERGLLRAHLEAHESHSSDVLVFGPIPVADESPNTLATDWTRQSTLMYYERLKQTGGPIWPDNATVDANSSLSREIFLNCGGFDESLLSARQNEELGIRLWRGGLPFVFAPDALTHHVFVKSNYALAVTEARTHGWAEVRISRKLMYARERSHLPAILRSSPLGRRAHRFVIGLPFSAEPLLRPAFGISQALIGITFFRRVGLKLMDWRRSIEFHRAAVREVGGLRVLAAEFWAELPVLMYHHIGPIVPGTNLALTVTAFQFERQLRYLKRHGYTTILPSDWLSYVERGKLLPEKPILLTFDDAYLDLVQYCFPLLKKYGFTGVVFVPTANIAGTNEWDQANWPRPHKLLSAEQIAEWAAQGIDFGGHTRTHPDLRYLTPEEMEQELEGGKRDLEVILGRPVVSFAYPYGHYGDREVEYAVSKFPLCFTTDEGKNILTTDKGRLLRIMINPAGLFRFRLCLAFGFDPIIRLRERLRLRTRVRKVWQTVTRATKMNAN